MCYNFASFFRNFEILRLEIIEEIPSLEVLHDNIDIIRVFKDIIEPNNIGMLAYLEHFNFSLQQFNVFNR